MSPVRLGDWDSPESLLERGRALRRRGSPTSAIPVLARAAQLAPDDAEIANELQQAHDDLRPLFWRIENLELRATILQTDAMLWEELGDALVQVDRDDDALAAYDHALEVDPDHIFVLASKGNLLNNMDRYEEALVVYAHLRDLEPAWSLPWTMTGMVLCNLRRYPDALPYLEQAAALDEGDISAWGMMGIALAALGHEEEAREAHARERAARLASGVPQWMPRDG